MSRESTPSKSNVRLEIPEGVFESVEKRELVENITRELLQEVATKYGEDGEDPLPFHGVEHSIGVAKRAVGLYLKVAGVAENIPKGIIEDEVSALLIAAAGHDTFVNNKDIDVKSVDGVDIRQGNRIRKRGWNEGAVPADVYRGNEYMSYDFTDKKTTTHDYDSKVLNHVVRQEIKQSIKTSLPEVQADFEVPHTYKSIKIGDEHKDLTKYLGNGGTAFRIYQKFNRPESSLSSLCMGLADISYVGNIPVEESVPTADCEYKEVSVQIMDELEKLGLDKIETSRKKQIIDSMLGWMKSQIQFGITQKYNFDMAVENNNSISRHSKSVQIKDAIYESHPHFDNFINFQVERFEKFNSKKYAGGEVGEIDTQIRDLCEALEIRVI